MFEIKDQKSFRPLDKNLNQDSQTWKPYDTQIRKNQFKLDEIAFDLNDVVLQGTSDSIEYMDHVVPRLQIRFNNTAMKHDAFKSCQDDQFNAEYQQSQFMEVKYWSINPATGDFQFSPVSCAEKIESLNKTAGKFFTWIYEDSKTYQNPDETAK